MEYKQVSLGTLNLGSLEEKFALSLHKVIENCRDPNTEAAKVRKITITLSMKPTDDARTEFGYATDIKESLAPFKTSGGVMYPEKVEGKYVAFETNPNQPELPLNVTNIEDQKKQKESKS